MKKLGVALLIAMGLGLAWLEQPVGAPRASLVSSQGEPLDVGDLLGKAEGEHFAPVLTPHHFEFPRDHGEHPDFKSEWWYTTGNLVDELGRRYGFELTFFRQALGHGQQGRTSDSAWAIRQVYMAHLALTDVDGKRFLNHERISRANLGLAGCTTQKYPRVWVEDWNFRQSSEQGFALQAHQDGYGLELEMENPKAPVLQGDHGRSRKGPEPSQSSYYYSMPRLLTHGKLWLDGQPRQVKGISWVDREWSSQPLARDLQGWDWFALQLDPEPSGSGPNEVMAYFLRRPNGTFTPYSGASLSRADGSTSWLNAGDLSLEVTDTWTSPRDGVRYPAGWKLHLLSQHRTYLIKPLLADQELDVSARYWEGAVSVQTRADGSDQPVSSGYGYVELVGYRKD